ncbi:hypothetical protein DL98DRAFT_609488 [Cadophora sp. DSE1049]|nr:hypothetical protein DL98DRAFT_609488 [Cadophora sp. DSE1049]
MLFKSVTCILALLFVAEAALSSGSFYDSSKRCQANTLKQYDIENETAIDIGVLRLQTQVVFPNGTHWIETSRVTDNTISVCKDATTGVWNKTGSTYSFKTSTDLKHTTITLVSPTLNGTYTLTAIAPGVYADGNLWPSRRATAKVMPYVYCDASVPSGKVTVNFNVAGTPLKFTGIGGHDRN